MFSTIPPVMPQPRALLRVYRTYRNTTCIQSRYSSQERRISSCFASAPDVPGKTIIVYSKDECPLCDGLKDKISGILDRAPFTGSALKDYSIEVRDILTNPSWEEKYSMQIPVMAVEQSDGREVRTNTTMFDWIGMMMMMYGYHHLCRSLFQERLLE